MAIQLTPALLQRLADLAAARHCSVEALVHEGLDGYLSHIEELTTVVREAEKLADREGWVPHEEVVARLGQRLKKSA